MSSRDTARRYRQAKEIATEALGCGQAEREALINDRCSDDQALRSEVEWLIKAAEDGSADEVPESFQTATRTALKQVSLEVPLPRNYRLIRRISQGGAGIVYLAERNDGDLRQQVALKLLHLTESPEEELAHRFATERRVLSRLNHPNIAHLIDGGLTSEGRPFMATEYVDGERLDRWCQRHRLDMRERVRLFIGICDAVEYAHRRMVIHRDLKPSNILVTDSGEPKLLDFGIARLIDADEISEHTAGQSDSALTLAYASPEQIEGGDLTTATDVYSLGVVLYELLAGRGPFADIEQPHAMATAVVEGRFDPPGRQAGHRVPHDLEAIVLKAMRRDAEQRYLSVQALADDLERYLSHRPVVARRGQWLYRARRFSWRHRWAMAAAAVIVGMLVAFQVDREAQLTRIAWERDRAEAVTEFMNEMFAGADSLPSRGNEVTVREILDLGAEQLARSGEENPAVLGSLYLAIGRAYNALGLGEQALPLLESARRALAPQLRLEERALIQAELGAALDSGGRAVEAIMADEQAIELYEQAPGEHREALTAIQIRKLRNHANVLDVALEDTIDELEALIAGLESANGEADELLFEARSALVGAHVVARQGDRALEAAGRVREHGDALYESGDPRRLRGRHVHATALMLSDPDQAIEQFAALIEDHERLVGPSQRLANTIGNYGVALSRVGRHQESLAAFARAADMIQQTVGRDHYLYRLSVANQAALQLASGRPVQAEDLIDDILPDLERRHREFGGVETLYRASALDILASALVLQDRLEQAAGTYAQALELLEAGQAGEWSALHSSISNKLAAVRRELDPEAP